MTKLVPTENQEMQKLMEWASFHPKLKHPLFGNVLVHVPNEGVRNPFNGARLFSIGGSKVGFPDIFIPIAQEAYHGMFIELKRVRHAKITPHQEAWLTFLKKQGYHAIVCYGADKAIIEIEKYLNE